MTKTAIIKWLEAEHRKTRLAAKDQYHAARKAQISGWMDEADAAKRASRIQRHLTCALVEYEELLESLASVSGYDLPASEWGTLVYTLREFTKGVGATLDTVRTRLTDKSQCNTLRKKHDETAAAINRNYENVMAAVRSMKNAKVALEYLQELGFDTTELEERDKAPVQTALAAPIDRAYLFVSPSQEGV